MRYPPNQRQTTRTRIISAASRIFAERGYRGTGVDAVMKAAGMTAGGFYAHFPSKEALFGESLVAAFHAFRKRLAGEIVERGGSASASDFVRRYFDVDGKAEDGEGSPINALAPDVARSGQVVREKFEDEFRRTAENVAGRMRKGAPPPGETALAILALCSGAILISRAVESPETADRILEACERFAERAGGG
jgi:TetR/AcrR family transcriptional repressor of nem operon